MSLSPGILIVFGVVLGAALLLGTRWVPVEVTALSVPVVLAVLEPWTGLTPEEAVSGFSSPGTLTVLAMFVLTEGVRRTGALRRVARRLARWSRGSERRELGFTLGLGGPPAGFVNNTPLVGVLLPLLVDLARRNRTSPSRLLIPLSFVSMLGGTLTLLGTATNLLASDLSDRLLGRPIGVFEITPLGAVVLLAGGAYLMTVGWRLLPERIPADVDLLGKFEMDDFLHRLRVGADSPLVGRTLEEGQRGELWDLDVLQIRRGRTIYAGPRIDRSVEAGDVLRVRADPQTAETFAAEKGLSFLRHARFTDATLVDAGHTIVELTVVPESKLVGETLVSTGFRNRYDGTVLGLGRGDRLIRGRVEEVELDPGDSLLVLLPMNKREVIEGETELAVTRVTPLEDLLRPVPEDEDRGRARTPVALGILAGVVLGAGAGLVPIHIAALGGVALMIVTGCVEPEQAYRSVGWDVVALLAGLIPLGIAMDRTGAGALLAEQILSASGGVPPVAVLGFLYLLTVALTNLIGNTASVVVMVPVAVDAAVRVGSDPFAFLLAVTFAAPAAFLNPMTYPTNLMVMGPGGYRFGDYARVGAPLQLLLAVVTTAGIALLWGV